MQAGQQDAPTGRYVHKVQEEKGVRTVRLYGATTPGQPTGKGTPSAAMDRFTVNIVAANQNWTTFC